MTHPTYTQQALCRYNLPRLKRIAAELGVTPTGDKRATQTWVNAIITHQSTQTHKVADNQALAQAELDHHIATQAQAVAPEPFRIVEISFGNHEYYAGNQLVASITHDDDHLTQRWLVMVNDKEVFRTNTVMRCHRFICIHYKNGTLPVQEEALGQGGRGAEGKEFVQEISSAQELKSTTGNEVMAQIFNECEKYGFEILDDGIYQNDQKLGEVGCTDGGWWVMRTGECQQMPCGCAVEAVRRLCPLQTSLLVVNVSTDGKSIFDEYFLEQPLEQLTGDKLQRLLDKAELITA
ncbi:hypothetical protein [Nostoc sphaeroides]|uniref:SAP domain-containing protein n=1 Tax=Nostoc sphaeroides CCNUC1 TaxID=2653204 RepID=A0A5P8WFA2_9NOSO|nr:hypothetical protein [Nostoc sphaeroides]QFS51507.1 hypothetical protein GXM_09001 [Nostoc sphaeroides CCNUC1]